MPSNITEPACRKALDECDLGGFPGKGDRTTILLGQASRSPRLMTTLAKWSVADYHRMIAAGILCDRYAVRSH